MNWDYSIYPELTEAQKNVFTKTGETLYMIQMAEHAVKLCNTFVFGKQNQFSLESIYNAEKKAQRKTLGQLLAELRKTVNIHPSFDELLRSFVKNRNRFAHEIFNDEQFSITSDEGCKKAESFLFTLQDEAWNVQNVFLGCILQWARITSVYEHLPESIKNNKHFSQLDGKNFHLLVQDPDNQTVGFDNFDIAYRYSSPDSKTDDKQANN
jgi:hypothetical protein